MRKKGDTEALKKARESRKSLEERTIFKGDKVSIFADQYCYTVVCGKSKLYYTSPKDMLNGIFKNLVRKSFNLGEIKELKEIKEANDSALAELRSIIHSADLRQKFV